MRGKEFSLPSLFLISVPAFHFACGGTPWQWTHAFPPLFYVPLPKVNNQENYEEQEKYVLAYSDNECEGWNHLTPELKTTTWEYYYGGQRCWNEVGCVVSMAAVLLLPWTSSPYKGNRWNLSFTCILTLYSKKTVLNSGLSQFLQDSSSVSAQGQGSFTDCLYIYPICGHLCHHS